MDSYWIPTGVLESSRNRWRSEKYCQPLLGSSGADVVVVGMPASPCAPM